MTSNRIYEHPVLGNLTDKEPITFTYDGITYKGQRGDTIASALLANGIRTLRVHEETQTPRGIYCNIGHCFECRVTINNNSGIRACLTELEEGMIIESGKGQPTPLKKTSENEELPRTYAEYKTTSKKEDDRLV
ncbi:(2Fe-2S)-binding protein [Virgibacillus sp. W0430]|uniref:(2Fe-2S)-binding protein n=1 Tax=Virgibacillus sp. W0430 TaxID=3391580 RepID=UPI003F476E04